MDRRGFLKKIKSKNRPASNRNLASGLTPYAGSWTTNEVAHLLKRTMFSARKADIDHFLSVTPGEAVDELLLAIPPVDPPLRDYGLLEDENGVLHDDTGVVQGQTWVNDLNNSSDPGIRGAINSRRIDSLHRWWTGLILNQSRSIAEKMVLFWHHHFSVQESEVENATHLWRHHRLFRENGIGNFKQLVRAVTTDPAMLLHLNGYLNSKLAPDENYAREMQELFTIGKGPDSGYTENDVIAAARVLTGWRINNTTLTSYFDSNAHDTGAKSFSSFYNNTTITNNDATEVDRLIDMIFDTTEAARFICRKLYKWFVYYQVDDATEANVITPLADLLRASNFDVQPVLAALLKSEHFFDPLNQACYIKNPFDIVAGTLREFNVTIPSYTDWQNGYPFFATLYEKAAGMQQKLFQPPDVSGWPAYYQEPMYYELWVNSNSLPQRARFTDALVTDRVLDLRAFAGFSSAPSNPVQLIDDMVPLLLRYPLSAASKTWIKNKFLLRDGTDNTIWTNAWNNNDSVYVDSALADLFMFLMNLPEFHLC